MLWGSNGAAAANSPMHSSEQFRANTGNQTKVFANVTASAFTSKQVLGVYGVTNTQVKAAESNSAHKTLNLQPGWWTVKQGMGPAVTVNITAGGATYSNNDKMTLTSSVSGAVSSGATVQTNTVGGVTGFGSFGNSGGLFVNTSTTTLAIINSSGGTPNGTGFTATVAYGGRAGRIQRECLVALGSMTSNSTYNPGLFPNT